MNKSAYLLIFFIGLYSFAQTDKGFRPFSITAELGTVSVKDMSFTSSSCTKLGTHTAIGARYSFNQIFGLSLLGAWENLEGTSTVSQYPTSLSYSRYNLEGNINLMGLFGMYSRNFTMLAHVGPGTSTVKQANGYSESMGQIHGGLSGIFRLGSNIGLRVDASLTNHFGQEKTLDGMADYIMGSSTIYNASAGIIVWLGRGEKEPADFFRKPECTTNVYITKSPEISAEYIFFEHDKAVLKGSQLPSVYKAYKIISQNDSKNVVIIGWASPTDGADRYNLLLSTKRCETIRSKLMELGISRNRITIDPRGKDYSLKNTSAIDMGRRIELVIK